ncbi:PREDICTED: uncharacterized protein LOC107195223 [Dufourea novaeangliae]|uniref:Tumor protein p53-inducible protein 13 n=1 Tax=Dufourea novaeangliae TaxID=178035 RepID=A0A154P708_DUFNO|nr:PREDICTED: uncharacterized protein LOC107195223 [Dufourea novaeangliae]KZC06978.1 hypothetical protein WN55_08215 [Dufourea novaeangliae]
MNAQVALILLICECVATSVANGQYIGDDYNEENLQGENVGFDRLSLLQKYGYNNRENRRNANNASDSWNGRWMPDRPGEPIPPPKIFPKTEIFASGSIHEIPMGQPSVNCDDARTNLTVDWNGSPADYTCYYEKLRPNKETIPHLYCEHIPMTYVARHKCMYEKIEYDTDIPLYGPHRPLWPVYGEYRFLPKQRWIHSMEHGAIVALYHPCANPLEVKRLKSLVTSCLRRHIISPYNLLDHDRPLALLAWGCRLTMSYVNPDVVIGFIREHALQGPEDIPSDGDFEEGLVHAAETVSDHLDTNLCPSVVRD